MVDLGETAASSAAADNEGVTSQLNSFAAADSDLIIIPTQGSHLDAKEAARSIKMINKLTRAVP